MSRTVKALTIVLWMLPALLLAGSMAAGRSFVAIAVLLLSLYGWVWARIRPSAFVVYPDRVEVMWPMKRRTLPRSAIQGVFTVDALTLRNMVGWGTRLGFGGLWGVFGWLWTTRRGFVRVYASRTDTFVWIDCRGRRPWLVTPEDPGMFVGRLSR